LRGFCCGLEKKIRATILNSSKALPDGWATAPGDQDDGAGFCPKEWDKIGGIYGFVEKIVASAQESPTNFVLTKFGGDVCGFGIHEKTPTTGNSMPSAMSCKIWFFL
jgi:hypothetical protein